MIWPPGLSVGPRRRDRGVDGSLVLDDTVGKRRDEACACSFQLWVKIYKATPQVGAVTMSSSPLGLEPWQVVLERALAHPEHIGLLTSQYPADETPTVSSEPNDLLYGDARLGLLEDCRVGVLTPKIALILDALGGAQQVGIYSGGADRDADLAHRFANRIEEGPAGVLHEVPTVSDLGGLRECLGR